MAGLVGVTQMILYVFGLPCLMLWFLIRNKDRLDEHVVQSRYGLFYAGYKRERFYWETVLSLRKIAIVGLGVFGPSLGPARQSQFACLILLICILLEIAGDPFNEPSPRHKILSKMERTSLLVLWLTMWSGNMIFLATQADDMGMVQLLTVMVALMTTGMMFWLVGQLIRECLYEKRDSAIVTNVTRIRRTFSEGVLSRTSSWRRDVDSSSTSTTVVIDEDEANGANGGGSAETTVKEVELRVWSQPMNPALGAQDGEEEEDDRSSNGATFMGPAPPKPKRQNPMNQTTKKKASV